MPAASVLLLGTALYINLPLVLIYLFIYFPLLKEYFCFLLYDVEGFWFGNSKRFGNGLNFVSSSFKFKTEMTCMNSPLHMNKSIIAISDFALK
jgi:hypothetical protein